MSEHNGTMQVPAQSGKGIRDTNISEFRSNLLREEMACVPHQLRRPEEHIQQLSRQLRSKVDSEVALSQQLQRAKSEGANLTMQLQDEIRKGQELTKAVHGLQRVIAKLHEKLRDYERQERPDAAPPDVLITLQGRLQTMQQALHTSRQQNADLRAEVTRLKGLVQEKENAVNQALEAQATAEQRCAAENSARQQEADRLQREISMLCSQLKASEENIAYLRSELETLQLRDYQYSGHKKAQKDKVLVVDADSSQDVLKRIGKKLMNHRHLLNFNQVALVTTELEANDGEPMLVTGNVAKSRTGQGVNVVFDNVTAAPPQEASGRAKLAERFHLRSKSENPTRSCSPGPSSFQGITDSPLQPYSSPRPAAAAQPCISPNEFLSIRTAPPPHSSARYPSPSPAGQRAGCRSFTPPARSFRPCHPERIHITNVAPQASPPVLKSQSPQPKLQREESASSCLSFTPELRRPDSSHHCPSPTLELKTPSRPQPLALEMGPSPSSRTADLCTSRMETAPPRDSPLHSSSLHFSSSASLNVKRSPLQQRPSPTPSSSGRMSPHNLWDAMKHRQYNRCNSPVWGEGD